MVVQGRKVKGRYLGNSSLTYITGIMADKKLAKKLAKMTEEERAEFLEQQRVQEEEEKKKKEEMLTRFLKDKLVKEEKATKLNMVKINNQWRAIMRKNKAADLRKDLDVMSQTFERIVDRKDAIIRSLVKDLEEAEEQYQVALRSHLHKVDDLIAFQDKRIKNLEEGYREELETVKKEFDAEREIMIASHDHEMRELSDIMYAMELRYSERETEAAHNFQSLMDELKNKNLEETHSLSAQRKAVLDELWLEFQRETKQYKDNTEERKLRFEALKRKDEESSHTIARQMRKLQKLQETIASLKQKMAINAKEFEEKTRAIRQDRETVLAHFSALKQEMSRRREAERSSLTKLTLQSDAAIKELQYKCEKGKSILTLAEMCRKLESEREKVLPFYSSSLSPEEEQEVAAKEAEPPSEPLAMVMQEYTSLQNFWKRYNKVLLDKLALDKEKQTLQDENSKLKALLQQYLDGISVNEKVLSKSNPLFVVNHRTTAPQVPVGDPRVMRPSKPNITVIEAAHVAKNTLA